MAKTTAARHGYPDVLLELGLLTGITERIWL